MSALTANTLLPLFAALPANEQAAFVERASKLLQKKGHAPKRKKRDIYDEVGDEYRPENIEILVTRIMNGV